MMAGGIPLAASFLQAGGSSASAMPWGSIGGFLGGMGQFAGGMSGLFGQGGMDAHKMQKKSKKFARQQMYRQMHQTIQARVRDARKAGIHPLAALGVSPASGPSAAFGMDSKDYGRGKMLANMGQGLQRALAGKSELDSAMAEYYRAMARKVSTPAIGGQGDAALVVDRKGVLKPSEKRGYQVVPAQVNPQRAHGYVAGPSGFYNFANVPDGGVQVYPTQKFQESTSEGFHALEYGIKMSGQWAKGISLNALNGPKAMMARNKLRDEQRAVEAEYGGRYAYSAIQRTWYPTNTNRLYYGTSKILGRFSRKYEYGSGRLQKSHRTSRFNRGSIENESWYFD